MAWYLLATVLLLLGGSNGQSCIETRESASCDFESCRVINYRTIDGTCNNMNNMLWGASVREFKRGHPPFYLNDDGDTPRGSTDDPVNGYPLPNPRLVSQVAISANETKHDRRYTHMVMALGQFLDHDLDLAPFDGAAVGSSSGTSCNDLCVNDFPCFPIQPAKDDSRLTSCIHFIRSTPSCGTGDREQVNLLTSYIDGSAIYGSEDEISQRLRDSDDNAFLQRGPMVAPGKHLLPDDEIGDFAICDLPAGSSPDTKCFLAGDVRSNEVIMLTTMHTLWYREHNRVAGILKSRNSNWSSEKVYQEARKIVGAELQHIAYTEWLPKLLGEAGMELLGTYGGYDPDIDASVLNMFATAAYRVGHTMVRPIIQRLDENFEESEYGNVPLHQVFFNPERIRNEGGIDPIVRGLYYDRMKRINPRDPVNTELTERLFELHFGGVGQDLASLNIQRGREHGLPTYAQMAAVCNVNTTESITGPRRRKLMKLYKTFDNIDLWAGGVMENEVYGGRLGPVFLCIIAGQFKAARDGDRFFYQNTGVFNIEQLEQIEKASMSRIICDNSDDIHQIQPDAFAKASIDDMAYCYDESSIPVVDLSAWDGVGTADCL